MTEPQRTSTRFGNRAVFLALFTGLGIGSAASLTIGFLSGLSAEYQTARAILEITRFVEQKKAWPTSWQDLGMKPMKRVRVHWSLDIINCDRHDVMTSVAPETGSFYTYPHAERQLQELWQIVSRLQTARSSHADAAAL